MATAWQPECEVMTFLNLTTRSEREVSANAGAFNQSTTGRTVGHSSHDVRGGKIWSVDEQEKE